MAQTNSTVTEKTFSKFTQSQGANYAQHRKGYHPTLYKGIISHHTSTGGELGTVLDIGCGPGTVASALAAEFQHAIGLDPSEGMIQQARLLGGKTASGEDVRFEISSAEELGSNLTPKVEDGSVDLITAATAAHWFNMPLFWKRAAEILKPGGTVAIWSFGGARSVDPSTPNADAIQASIDAFNEGEISAYFEPGNKMAHNLYVDLGLPWTLTPPVTEFDKETYFRKEWGAVNNEKTMIEGTGRFEMTLDVMEKFWGTASPIQRWRDAHPEKAGTEEDIVKKQIEVIKGLLHEAGVKEGEERVTAIVSGVTIMVKKKA